MKINKILENFKTGAEVIYWSYITENNEKQHPIETTIETNARELGNGAIVCTLKGLNGNISIKNIDLKDEKN